MLHAFRKEKPIDQNGLFSQKTIERFDQLYYGTTFLPGKVVAVCYNPSENLYVGISCPKKGFGFQMTEEDYGTDPIIF